MSARVCVYGWGRERMQCDAIETHTCSDPTLVCFSISERTQMIHCGCQFSLIGMIQRTESLVRRVLPWQMFSYACFRLAGASSMALHKSYRWMHFFKSNIAPRKKYENLFHTFGRNSLPTKLLKIRHWNEVGYDLRSLAKYTRNTHFNSQMTVDNRL